MKKLLFIQSGNNLEPFNEKLSKERSPFLLNDYAGPMSFNIEDIKSTHLNDTSLVTVVYSGEFEFRDPTNPSGFITPNDVKWMNGDSGFVNSSLTNKLETRQLWINLPIKTSSKLNLNAEAIPLVQLPNDAGKIRVVSGDYEGTAGPVHTISSINLWDMRLNTGHTTIFKVPADQTAAIFVLSGQITLNDGNTISEAELGFLEIEGDTFSITTNEHSKILFLGGEPLNEPVINVALFNFEQLNLEIAKQLEV